jgi:hypothetical protein
MTNSAHIFKELIALMPELEKRYKPKDVFYIGLRLADKQVPKVEVFFEELLAVLFNIIDTNARTDLQKSELHPIWQEKDYWGCTLVSVFVCDVTSQTVYDSRQYQQMKQKYELTQDKDGRVRQFNRLDKDGKEQVVDLMVAQMEQMFQDAENGQEPTDTGSNNSWGEMPWDFQE